MPKRRRASRARVVVAAGISAAVLVAGGGAVSYATSRGSVPTYVTATAGAHSVLQSLQATGTTQPSSTATVSFAVSGTVATVDVAMGDHVTAGQVLATLDSTALKYALATAQGQVANANLTRVQAETGQVSAASGAGSKTGTTGAGSSTGGTGSTTASSTKSSSTGTGSTKTSTTGTGATTGGSGSSHSGSGSTAPITAAQKTLLVTVRRADALLAKTKADLTQATTLCATPPTTPPITPTTPPATPSTPPATPSTASTPPSTPPVTSTGGKASAAPAALTTALSAAQNVVSTTTPTSPITCIQGQQLVLGDESQLLTLQQGLSTQEMALDKLISSAAASTRASTGKAPTGTAPIATAPAGTSSNGTSSAGAATAAKASAATSGGGATTVAVSAAQLAADQSAVDAANAKLVLAQQQLSQATIVSPLTGLVSSVGLTVGQQAAAGSTSSAIDVIDPTGHGVTLSVDVTKIPQVKVGEKATVVPDGSSVPLAATVSYVAAAPTSSSSTAYDVQLAFATNPTTLRDGIQAAVTITTSQAVNALAVPTSAVNHRGALSYVLVPNGATTKAQVITVGSVGAIYTQVTGGLTTGQRVVLANPNTPIPTSAITGRVARITGGVASGTAGVLGGSTGGGIGGAGATRNRAGG